MRGTACDCRVCSWLAGLVLTSGNMMAISGGAPVLTGWEDLAKWAIHRRDRRNQDVGAVFFIRLEVASMNLSGGIGRPMR